uniref:Borealin C-terminal domain-containing protein n=1 Tax=Anolis carolinensis TaxID=28377 RepID=A0A803T5U0_ANOCA
MLQYSQLKLNKILLARSKNGLYTRKLSKENTASFLDCKAFFDQEVERCIKKLKVCLKILQENSTILGEMSWISCCILREDKTALEQLALEGADIQEIKEMTSKAFSDSSQNCPESHKTRVEAKQWKLVKNGCPHSKEGHKLSTPVLPKGGSAATAITQGVTLGFAPRFDFSIFKTSGLWASASHEPIFSIFTNGSPLAGSRNVFITLLASKGESICVKVSDLTEKDLLRLNQAILCSTRKLSAQILHLCK